LSYIVADYEFLLFRQHLFTSDVYVACSAEDCLEMLDKDQKSFEEEHKISQVVMVHWVLFSRGLRHLLCALSFMH